MAKCEFCGKDVKFGIKVSHSHRRSNRTWKPNVQRVKAIVDGSPKRVYACTRCLRSGKVTRANWFYRLRNSSTITVELFFCIFCIFIRILNLTHSTERRTNITQVEPMRSVRITTARGASPVWTTPSLPPLLSDVSGVSDVELIFFVTDVASCEVTGTIVTLVDSCVSSVALVDDSAVEGSAVVGSA